jgi:Phosphodiester glycosidase
VSSAGTPLAERVRQLMPQLKDELARLVAIPGISAWDYPEETRPALVECRRELAEVMVELGAESAINLDGGGSTTLVHRGHLLNRPYSSQDQPAPASRRVVSALTFLQRS